VFGPSARFDDRRGRIRRDRVSGVLVVAYGNPWRGDDALGWQAAADLEATVSPCDVEIVRVPQLTPELAESVSQAEAVIFVDAACVAPEAWRQGDVRIKEVRREDASASEQSRFSHRLTPALVLALAAKLYDANPRAYSATMNP
jgi:hydrogenase maturation protease